MTRSRWLIVAAIGAVVVLGLVFAGLALTAMPGPLDAGSDTPAVVESTPPAAPTTPTAPPEAEPSAPPTWTIPPSSGDAENTRPPDIEGICWVLSGGGWLGAPCPPDAG